MMKWIKFLVISSYLLVSNALISVSWGQARLPARPTSATALVESRVLDAQTKQPIIGATVSAKSQSGTMRAQQVVTTDGTYQLILDPRQPYLISFRATGYEPHDEPLTLTSPKTTYIKPAPTRLYRIGTKPASTTTAALPATVATSATTVGTGMAKRVTYSDSLVAADGLAPVDGVVIRAGTNMGIRTATVQIKSLQGSVLAQTETTYQARYFFRVDPRASYRITAKADGYEPYEEPIVFTAANASQESGKPIYLQPISTSIPTQPNTAASAPPAAVPNAAPRVTPPKTLDAKVVYMPPLVVAPAGKTTQLRAIQFVQSKAELLPDAGPALEQLLTFLQTNPTAEIELRGHTDNQGDFDENVRLSKQRVEVVKEQLVKNGIAPGRIKTRGFGPTQPIAGNSTEATRQLNRRVELVVLKP